MSCEDTILKIHWSNYVINVEIIDQAEISNRGHVAEVTDTLNPDQGAKETK